MILYRVTHKDHGYSMWYDQDGTPNRIIDKLSDDRLSKLPMEPDYEKYHADGKRWQCAGWSLEHLSWWFQISDITELIAMGFEVVSFTATEYIVEENQVLFTFDSINSEIKVITGELLDYLIEKTFTQLTT